MDFVRGQVLDKLWPTLDDDGRKSMVKRVAELIQRLQSTPPRSIGPGPVGGDGEPWLGPFFTHYGDGPFATLLDLEDWYNHKLNVCTGLYQVPEDALRFRFDIVVLSHPDIAPRNIIIEEGTDEMVLIDWAIGGIFPVGFEKAALALQFVGEWDIEFSDAVVNLLPKVHDYVAKQLDNIGHGLTTGAFL